MKVKSTPWLALGGFVILVLALAHGFRTKSDENSPLGTFYYKYSLWRPSVVSVDSNNDGEVDAIGFLINGAEDFRDPFKEYLEDRDFDGHFEIRAIYLDGVLQSVEVDEDRDGSADKLYIGHEAEEFFLRKIDRYRQGTLH